GADDAFSEVLGRIVLRGRCRAEGSRGGDERATARGTELLARRGGLATVWALELQPGAAVLTEPRTLRVLGLALRALHPRPSQGPAGDRAGWRPDGSLLPGGGSTDYGSCRLWAGRQGVRR